MDFITGIGGAAFRSAARRLAVPFAVLAFAVGGVLLIQQQSAGAQLGDIGDLIRSIVCPILLAVRNAFADTFIGSIVTPILNQFLVAFGCAPSG